MAANQKIYDMITERVVQKLNDAIKAIENGELGIAPWKRPWFQAGIPMNLKSKKAYRGINVFLLSALGYASPYFVSYKQAMALGGKVKKGEKGCPVVFWKIGSYAKDKDGNPLTDKDGNLTTKKSFLLRYYTVFNVEQCEGFEDKIPEIPTREFNPIEDAEKIINEMPNPPSFDHKEARAYYRPSQDHVNMPKRELFDGEAEYYSVAFHELVHATGHTTRLNRSEVMDSNFFGNHDYSREELVAEMGAVFLCNYVGLDAPFENSLAYLKSWLGKFKDDTTMLIQASGRAQKATDYILNVKHENKENDKKDSDKKE